MAEPAHDAHPDAGAATAAPARSITTVAAHPAGAIDPAWVAAAAARLVAATRPEALAALRRELDVVIPGPRRRALAALTPDCPRAPIKLDGTVAASGAELARIAETVGAHGWTVLAATVGGAERQVLAIASPAAPRTGAAIGSLFVIEIDEAPDHRSAAVAAGLCAVVAELYASRADETEPARLVENLAAAQERARTISEMSEAHEAALAAVLAPLRSRHLDDAAARAAATAAASAALVELRAVGERDRALGEIPAEAAFERLGDELRSLCRHAGVSLELVAPSRPRVLATEVANGARAVTRGLALVLLEQRGPSRLRVAWSAGTDALSVSVRDDGPGELTAASLATHHTSERVAALGGTLDIDSVAGWGTSATAELPLAPLVSADANPLATLNTREREVLAEVARGHRNRDIADALAISPHTVKFHVANILRKLDVATRGEAAIVARDHGLDGRPWPTATAG
ncbi:MAG: LuxR C-terminal-related transcriptional regulator [Actinomycetota bacterium]|nr:LuxR C-terminal-related transcriptional regulator [Actinomycetota bacterium]